MLADAGLALGEAGGAAERSGCGVMLRDWLREARSVDRPSAERSDWGKLWRLAKTSDSWAAVGGESPPMAMAPITGPITSAATPSAAGTSRRASGRPAVPVDHERTTGWRSTRQGTKMADNKAAKTENRRMAMRAGNDNRRWRTR